jgi:hypothetical protein
MITNRLLFVGLAFATALCGCAGGGSTFSFVSTGSGSQLAKSSSLSIAFQAALPQLVAIGSTTEVTAIVSNDPVNAGVDWLVTCNDMDCGSLSVGNTSGRAIHSESNQPVSYTAPAALTGAQLAVNIIAFATSDHTRNVVATINVTP